MWKLKTIFTILLSRKISILVVEPDRPPKSGDTLTIGNMRATFRDKNKMRPIKRVEQIINTPRMTAGRKITEIRRVLKNEKA